MLNTETEKAILTRLRTVKGHIAGIERMVENKENCADILVQISATRSAIEKMAFIFWKTMPKTAFAAKQNQRKKKNTYKKLLNRLFLS